MTVLVTGGTGFVGSGIVHALRAEDRPVRCLVRDRRQASRLASWGCELVEGDVTDAASLRPAVEGCDRVIHLVAIRSGKRRDFERIMEQGTRDLVAAAREAGVGRFVLMSALGTTAETKDLVPYYHAKWEMEQTVKASGFEHVIFRPSFVFAEEGSRRSRRSSPPASSGSSRSGATTSPPTSRSRSTYRGPRTARSSSAGPTSSRGTSSGSGSGVRCGCAARSCTCPCR